MTDVERLLRETFVEDAELAPESPDPTDVRALTGRRRPLSRWAWPLVGAAASAAVVGGLAVGGLLGTGRGGLPTDDGPLPLGSQTAPDFRTTLIGEVPCPDATDELPHLPKGLSATTAYVCDSEERTNAAGDIVLMRVVRRVTGGLAEALAAYAVADVPPSDGSCDAILYARHTLVLRVGNEWVFAREPIGSCSEPNDAAVAAYERLTTVEVASTPGSIVSTPLGRASGCGEAVKDTLDLAGTTTTTTPPGAPGAGTVVCYYNANGPAPTKDGELRDATLTGAGTLSAADAAVVTEQLAAARPGTCDVRAHTRFALVLGLPATTATTPATTDGTDGGSSPSFAGMPWTEVALDGCGVDLEGRALVGSQALRDALIRTLRDHPVVAKR